MTTSKLVAIIFTIFLKRAICLTLDDLTLNVSNIPPKGRMQFCELVNSFGLECVRYNVTTEDGYILGVFNIPGDRSKPIFLQHGFVDSSDTFVLRTNTSIVANLAAQGYDIWFGNMRGNKHSRAHVRLNPNELPFFEFSFHEIALYDVPAMIDFVLCKTGQDKLAVIAHSEGTTLFFVLGSMRPEYSNKLSIVICMAPIVYLHNAEKPIFPLLSVTVGPIVNPIASIFRYGELLRNSSILVRVFREACTLKVVGYAVCAAGLASSIFGYDLDQLEPEFFSIAIGHYPAGSSVKNLMHLQQLVSRRQFAPYDYGYFKNLEIYKSAEPPVYDLSKVNIKIALVVGLNDRISDIDDVRLLRKQLPNLVDYHVMKRKKWNHIDFVWGKNMTSIIVYLRKMLSKYYK